MLPFLALFQLDKKQLDAASLTDTRSIIHRAVKLLLLQRQPREQRASHRKCQRQMLAKNKKVKTKTATSTATTTTHYCLPSAQKGAFIFQVFAEKCERPSTLITPKEVREGEGKGVAHSHCCPRHLSPAICSLIARNGSSIVQRLP